MQSIIQMLGSGILSGEAPQIPLALSSFVALGTRKYKVLGSTLSTAKKIKGD